MSIVSLSNFFEKDESELLLEIKESIVGKGAKETASIYSKLGDLHFIERNLDKASIFYQKALHIRREVLGENHLQTAKSYFDLALFYVSEEEFETAEIFFKRALDIREELLSENSLELAENYSHLGICSYYLFKYEKAFEYLNKALYIKESVLALDDNNIEILKNNLKEIEKHISKSENGIFSKVIKYFYHSSK